MSPSLNQAAQLTYPPVTTGIQQAVVQINGSTMAYNH